MKLAWASRAVASAALILAISGFENTRAAQAGSAPQSSLGVATQNIANAARASAAERARSTSQESGAAAIPSSIASSPERGAVSSPVAFNRSTATSAASEGASNAASSTKKETPAKATPDERDEITFSLKDMSFHVSSSNKPLVWCVALVVLGAVIFLVYKGFGPGKSKEPVSTSKAWLIAAPFIGLAAGLLIWFFSNREKPQEVVLSTTQSAALASVMRDQLSRLDGQVTQQSNQLKSMDSGLPDKIASAVTAKLQTEAATERPVQANPDSKRVASPPSSDTRQAAAAAQPVVSTAPSSALASPPSTEAQPKVSQTPPPALTKSSWTNYLCTYITARKDQKKELDALDTVAAQGKTFCTPRDASTLIPGDGDVVVVLAADQFYTALSNKPPTQPWLLSINGKSLGDSAYVDSQIARNNEVLLRFRVVAGTSADSLAFWSSAYQRTGFHTYEPLLIELGWEDIPEYFRPPGKVPVAASYSHRNNLRVAGRIAISLALVSGLAVLGIFAWTMERTDLFRVAPSAGYRAAYSFARVQWGAWMLFALMAALYLWVIYGNFPDLTGSVAILVGVSTLTATTSFFIDPKTTFPPVHSGGLLRDLLSDSNDDLQAHRFQALVVNTLLLVAGVVFVGRHLSYPEFPDTWLAMLGISNAGALAGKQILENKKLGGGDGGDKTTESSVSKLATMDIDERLGKNKL